MGERQFIQNLWSEDEIARLRELSKTLSNKEIAKKLNRTPDSVRGQREMLGIKLSNPKLKAWTESEIEQVKILSESKSNREIAEIIGRTRSAVQQLKFKQGFGDFKVRKWTKAEVSKLKKLAKEQTTAELAEYFNREWTAVERKCKELGIVTQSKHVEMRDYTEKDTETILKFSRYMTNLQLAEKLGRTEGSVKAHKTRLRKKGYEIPYYTQRQNKI